MARTQLTIWCVGFLLAVGGQPAAARQVETPARFDHLTMADGLSQSTVTSILQDRRGVMWFGTFDGLNSWDGYTFTVYKHDADKANSLSHNWVISLLEASDGAIWVGTQEGGLNRFDPATEEFDRFRSNPDAPRTLGGDVVSALYEDADGLLWIGTLDGGVSRFNPKHETFSRYRHDPDDPATLADNRVAAITGTEDGLIWIASANAINRLDPATGRVSRLIPDGLHSGVPTEQIHLATDDSGTLWVGRSNMLYRFDPFADRFDRIQPNWSSDVRITALTSAGSGSLWIGTRDSGLIRFDPTSDRLRAYTHDQNNPASIAAGDVQAVFTDRSGMLWAGTIGGGLSMYSRISTRFGYLSGDPAHPLTPPGIEVRSVLEGSDGTLWIGTAETGLLSIDRSTGDMRRYAENGPPGGRLTFNFVTDLWEDPAGRIWARTDAGFHVVDPTSGAVRRVDSPADLVEFLRDDRADTDQPGRRRSMSPLFGEAADGSLWMPDSTGLMHLRPGSGDVRRYSGPDVRRVDGAWRRVRVVHVDRAGGVWRGSDAGLERLDPELGTWTLFQSVPDDPSTLSSDRITSILERDDGILWIGTYGGGLNRLDATTGVFTRFGERDGLSNNTVYGVLEGADGSLWMSTNRGISRFDPSTSTFSNYGTADGVQGEEFSSGAWHRSASTDELFFGGVNGVTAFHSNDIVDDPYVPPVVFTQIIQHGDGADEQVIRMSGLDDPGDVRLAHDESHVTIEFAALSYLNSHANMYRYRLEGADDTWIELGRERRITFASLNPGEYSLHVQGANHDGVWNREGARLGISVAPPWWRTTWAYMVYAALFVGGLVGLRRYEMERMRLKNRLEIEQVEADKLRELDDVKSRFFANISHEFRTPLTLILSPVQEALEAGVSLPDDQLPRLKRNSERLLRLVNQLLDLSKLESGSTAIKASRQDLIPFLKGIVHSFESLARQKRVTLSETSEADSAMVEFEAEKLEHVFVNLISNALKFTDEGGSVEVHCRRVYENTIRVSVRDTGRGIPPDRLEQVFDRFYQVDSTDTRSSEGTGIGLSLAKAVVELHGGKLSVASEEGEGTTFFVELSESTGEATEDRLAGTQDDADDLADDDRPVILIAEDNSDVRAYLVESLSLEYRVVECENGSMALERARRLVPDLIITDVMMPGMDGYALATALKSGELTSHIPVIMLTARAADEDKIKGLETRVDDYLLKPFNVRELLVRVRNLIALRRSLRERFSGATVIRPEEVEATSIDRQFLERVAAAVERRMDDAGFGVGDLAEDVGISVSQLNRKLNALIGQSAGKLIRSMRLQRGADLLERHAGTVAEIAFQVGYSTQAHFSTAFKKQFGVSPSEFSSRPETS